MKKAIMILMITSMTSAIFAEGSVSGVSYFSYSMKKINTDLGVDERGFELNRVYLTYNNEISDKVSFQFQADMQNTNKTEETAYYMYIKKAQLDLKVTNGAKLIIGMQGMNMFNVAEKNWGNRFLRKTAMDMNKWSASADLGVGVELSMGCPFIESNKIYGSLLVTNGEGYKSTSSDNYEKISFQAMYGENRLDKKDGFNIGTVYSTLKYANDQREDTSTETVMGIFTGFAGFGLRAGLEYHMGTDLNNEYEVSDSGKNYQISYGSSSTLMSFYANYSLSFIDGLSLFGRYDMVDLGNEDYSHPYVSTMMAGLVYNCTEGLIVAPHIVQNKVDPNDDDEGIENYEFHLSFQFKF